MELDRSNPHAAMSTADWVEYLGVQIQEQEAQRDHLVAMFDALCRKRLGRTPDALAIWAGKSAIDLSITGLREQLLRARRAMVCEARPHRLMGVAA
jgi:hypothetical protein